jgi:hypothetical protein
MRSGDGLPIPPIRMATAPTSSSKISVDRFILATYTNGVLKAGYSCLAACVTYDDICPRSAGLHRLRKKLSAYHSEESAILIGGRRGISYCVENTQGEIPLRRLTDRNDSLGVFPQPVQRGMCRFRTLRDRRYDPARGGLRQCSQIRRPTHGTRQAEMRAAAHLRWGRSRGEHRKKNSFFDVRSLNVAENKGQGKIAPMIS